MPKSYKVITLLFQQCSGGKSIYYYCYDKWQPSSLNDSFNTHLNLYCFWNQWGKSEEMSLLWSKSEIFFEKNIFHPRVPPLCFEPFWTICPARFRKWQGVNLKIGISSFHRSFSFCYKQIAWYLVSSVLKMTHLTPPPTRWFEGRVIVAKTFCRFLLLTLYILI